MNIEHLKGKKVRCTSDTAVINPEYIKDSWYDVVSDGDHFWIGKIGGWRLEMDNLDYDYFDLANPRTPIDTDKMMECCREAIEMLELIKGNRIATLPNGDCHYGLSSWDSDRLDSIINKSNYHNEANSNYR